MSAPRKQLLISPHLNDAQLVAYLDGELSRSEMDAARSHVGSCWSCRSRVVEVQAGIDNFLHVIRAQVPFAQVMAVHARLAAQETFGQFDARLLQADEEDGLILLHHNVADDA